MKILIAEDDLTSRCVLAAVLKKGGHEVVETADGVEAWDELQKPDAPKGAEALRADQKEQDAESALLRAHHIGRVGALGCARIRVPTNFDRIETVPERGQAT